jgi:cytochrome P450
MLGLLGEYGDVVCVGHRRFQPIYLLSHPDHIKHVLQDNHLNYGKGKLYNAMKRLLGEGLVTSEGETWHRQRRSSQSACRHHHDEELGRVMVDATAAMLEPWPARATRAWPCRSRGGAQSE